MLNYKNIFGFIISICFLFGCGGSTTKIENFYNKTFTDYEEVECPEAKFIKGYDSLSKLNTNQELLYTLTFNQLEWVCYVLSDDDFQNYYIEVTANFGVEYEVDEELIELDNFNYVIAILDVFERVASTNKFLYDFKVKNEKKILLKVNIEKIGALNESTLLFGFIK